VNFFYLLETSDERMMMNVHTSQKKLEQKFFEDRYILGKKLGQGTFGMVYESFDTYTCKTVACKIPHETSSMIQQNSIIDEGNLLKRLEHRSVPKILDMGILGDGRPYFSMSLIKAETLEKKLLSGSLSAYEGLEVISRLSEILEEVHEQGILHCDLKPANILRDADGEVYLIDWGTAELVKKKVVEEPGKKGTFSLKGTPLYIAPELIRGGKRTLASEQYALGVMLYEMLTKHFPFFEENLCSLFSKVCFQEPKQPSLFPGNSPITATLEGLSLRLLSKTENERFVSMKELRRALRELSLFQNKQKEGHRPAWFVRPGADLQGGYSPV
jgi:serine/threonine protein kinase